MVATVANCVLKLHRCQAIGGLILGNNIMARRTGRLALWQESRAKEFMSTNLAQGLSLEQIAKECGLSGAHFARYFKNSTGMPAHVWLQRLRIEKAKELLRTCQKSLAQVALECGFADQSHFTRVFKNIVGAAPVGGGACNVQTKAIDFEKVIQTASLPVSESSEIFNSRDQIGKIWVAPQINESA